MTQAVVQSDQRTKSVKDGVSKYLTFNLGTQEYGLEILKVREIIGYLDVTAGVTDQT